jgi:hypothetical protein
VLVPLDTVISIVTIVYVKFCIVKHMINLASSRNHAIHGHGGAIEAVACAAEAAPVAIKPRWRPSEDEIVSVAIAVVLLSLMAIIAVAAAAILTMG